MPTLSVVDGDHATFYVDMELELQRIRNKGYELHSLHEGYGLLLEELAEAFDIIRLKPEVRDTEHLRSELVQIATMAQRMAALLKKQEDEQNTRIDNDAGIASQRKEHLGERTYKEALQVEKNK